MADINGIAEGVATGFSTVTPPTGYDPLALCTHELPDALTTLPALLVFPPSGQWTFNAGASRVGDLTFAARFYYGPKQDMASNAIAINEWHSVLIDALLSRLALGQSTNGVTHAFITSSPSGSLTYAGMEYVGIEFAVGVHLVEGINPVQ